ncbi:4a-hydroxytetrahydrobiopterin dehydratase [Pedobacter sp.]|nr:4a-hydroxytetrahydrobiopterin dehydratase [Candidatus Saccharibacteria bacterium]
MKDKLENLSYDWSLIDGQGLVRVIPIDAYKTGFVLITRIGILADEHDYYPDLTLGREKVTITIDDADETKAYALAAGIDKILPLHATDAV